MRLLRIDTWDSASVYSQHSQSMHCKSCEQALPLNPRSPKHNRRLSTCRSSVDGDARAHCLEGRLVGTGRWPAHTNARRHKSLQCGVLLGIMLGCITQWHVVETTPEWVSHSPHADLSK